MATRTSTAWTATTWIMKPCVSSPAENRACTPQTCITSSIESPRDDRRQPRVPVTSTPLQKASFVCGYFLLLFLICSLVTACAAEASPGGLAPTASAITVLLYDHIGVPLTVLDEATQVVTSVYGRADVTIAWKTCLSLQTGRRMLDDCRRDLHGDELVVRMTRPANSPQWNVRSSALGVAVVLDGATGFYVSVYYSRVKDLAESQRVRPGLVLGYTIAHEVGHLLLRSTAHSPLGLMRSGWDSESRKQAERGRLYLLRDQSKQAWVEASRRAATAQQNRAGN
jgi:hypothetical protein